MASRFVRSNPEGTGRERVAHLLYRSVIGCAAVPGTEGDGLVPAAAAALDGARQLVLDGAIHSPGAGAPWYGSNGAVDVWWPAALETGRAALGVRARAAGLTAPSATATVPGAGWSSGSSSGS